MPVSLARPSGNVLFALVAAAAYGTVWALAQRLPSGAEGARLAAALVFDLAVTVPLLYVGLVARPAGRSWTRALPIGLVGVLAARWILPASVHGLVSRLDLVLAPLELGLLGAVAWRLRAAARRSAHGPRTLETLPECLDAVLAEALGPGLMARLLAAELGTLALAVRGPFAPLPSDAGAFSMHRRAGTFSVLWALALALVVESAVVHLLVHLWSAPAAWALTATSGYTLLYLAAHAQALRHRPIRLHSDALDVRHGLLGAVHVPFEAMEVLARLSPPLAAHPKGAFVAVPSGPARYRIGLRASLAVTGLMGRRTATSEIRFALDDPDRFDAAFREAYRAWKAAHATA